MSKGIKMNNAYKRGLTTAAVVNIQELSKSDNGNLLCEDACCRARVEYNSGYARQATSTIVAPYLKLAKNCVHDLECKNSISGAVKGFVRNSNDIENTPDIFEDAQDGSFIFRLNFLNETKEQLNKLTTNILTTEYGAINLGSELVEIEHKLASYCKSAAGISRLRSLIQDKSDIAEFESLIKIQYKNEKIMWKDFFYDDERYHVLYNRLSRGEIDHPVAIRVTLKVIKNSAIEQYPISLQCYPEMEDKKCYTPWVNLHKNIKAPKLNSDASYIILGHANHSEKNIFRNLKFIINNKQQIVKE